MQFLIILRSPLLLCFDQAHFSALVAMRQTISTTLQGFFLFFKL